ncbi:TPA: hypothetical protein QCR00_005472, partial [Bacillus cereus]|nr:hypothetical protein [Bacillus cereus]
MENQIKDIKEIDLLNYISRNHKMEQCGPNMYRVNPCPICGHRDHFTVYTDTNSWTSFAKCHEKISGGSIIDYVMAVEGAESVNDAIEKLGG